ncbi:unnamed protein product [Soboliphyme baturini]|uniref:Bestrophin homolog n=1 Tax=Soboliphyme baturini TaxID=241478 RepID=A0A183IUB7_9BILA|nr:unnamed protein product [Soboliphyme baturini]
MLRYWGSLSDNAVRRNRELVLICIGMYVKDKRPSISPNFNFLGQLLEFEQQLNLRWRGGDLPYHRIPCPFVPSTQSSNHVTSVHSSSIERDLEVKPAEVSVFTRTNVEEGSTFCREDFEEWRTDSWSSKFSVCDRANVFASGLSGKRTTTTVCTSETSSHRHFRDPTRSPDRPVHRQEYAQVTVVFLFLSRSGRCLYVNA